MKTASTLCLAAALLSSGVSCQRVLQEAVDLEFVGVAMGAGSGDEGSGTGSAEQLVQALESDDQVTVVGPVELGEFSCPALSNVVNAPAVSMTIHDEKIVAGQTSYSLTDGSSFEDGLGRHVWTGLVSDPEQAEDEALPRTVSLSWGEECTVETFLLKITKRNTDGTTTMIKTVPCIDSKTTTCLVEVLVDFDEPGEVIIPEGLDVSTKGGRRMQEGVDGASDEPQYTIVDVMVLYTEQAKAALGGVSDIQMITYLLESLIISNQAFTNSEVPVKFHPALISLAPFEETNMDGIVTLDQFRTDAAVMALRDMVEADLVQLIGYFNDGYCGWGYGYYNEAYGYSLVKSTCLDNFVHTHEYGHNFGCYHNRESSYPDTEYSHGLRYCDGLAPYRTIMSYSCGSPYGNYFSNPDVSYLGRPTGTPTEDNARTIEDNMVGVANFRGDVFIPPTPAPTMMPTMTITEPPTPSPTVPATEPPTMAPYEEVTPTSYSSVGCYKDSSSDRVLTGESKKGDVEMTTEKCAMLCEGSAYFGTEYANECFCGPKTDDPTRKGPATCNFPCAGDDEQTCGGNNAISLYEYISYPFVGCFVDVVADRVLSGDKFSSGDMTTKICAEFCEGSPYFGTEYGVECFCGVMSDDPDEFGEATCNFDCAGDDSETCGGSFAISVYQYPDVIIVPTPTFLGCWGDAKNGRIMMNKQTDGDMTTDVCQNLCTAYPFFGLQYGVECWCGDEDTDHTTYGASEDCTFTCGGDATEICGGRNAMSVWEY